ncbi:radical SAM-linked protein [Knoellia remsis]|uniref:Radical SAM-linked protein n=1 Tax=Knoellia remsis TaxID=407159 RepID=A0A2T0U872_9MICO|nr:TIGR03936 family radical SAM-associated protein [Knoellia remsis]PRY54114.1 radical SAM-linked protein [Knoellia remsis]
MARKRTPEGPPPPPPVQKLRIRYARRGRLRFSSTRDFGRALERALRRSGVPMAFSAGFHPHPKISYAGAAPTGTASEAEYFEISVTERVDPDAVRAALDAALPDDLEIIEVVEAGPGSLAERLEASVWRLELHGVTEDELSYAVERFLAVEVAEVTRTFKTGPKTFDTRSAVLAMDVVDDAPATTAAGEEGPCAILQMVVRHTTPSVRPDDILTALHAVTEFQAPVPPRVTRLAQGPLTDAAAGVADPLAADKDAVGS